MRSEFDRHRQDLMDRYGQQSLQQLKEQIAIQRQTRQLEKQKDSASQNEIRSQQLLIVQGDRDLFSRSRTHSMDGYVRSIWNDHQFMTMKNGSLAVFDLAKNQELFHINDPEIMNTDHFSMNADGQGGFVIGRNKIGAQN